MLDIKRIRANPEEVMRKLDKRGGGYNIDQVLELDEKRRSLLGGWKSLKVTGIRYLKRLQK